MSINLKSLEILNDKTKIIMCIACHASYCTYFLHAYPGVLPSFFGSLSKLTHHYNTRANFKKKMDNLEQENRELREEVSALKSCLGNLTTLMEALVVAQNQPPSVQPQPTRPNFEVPTILVSATPVVVQNRMPEGYPWGMPENFAPEGFNLGPQDAPVVQTVVTPTPPVVHTVPAAPPLVNLVPFVNEDMCRPFPPPSEDLGLYDRMDDFQEKFDRIL